MKCIYGNKSSTGKPPITEINFYRMPTKTHSEIMKAADDDVEPVPLSFYPSSAVIKIDQKIGRKSMKKILIYHGTFDLSDELFKTTIRPETCLVWIVFLYPHNHKNVHLIVYGI